jgi:hypothetical protein
LFRAGIVLAAITAIGPASVFAGDPVRDGVGQPGQGEPDNDNESLALTPEQAAFMQLKQRIADSLGSAGAIKGSMTPNFPLPPCWPDPCATLAPTPTPTPSPPALPASKVLDTRARQQINGYYCGPASGQVVVNWSRRVFITTLTKAGAEDPALNWKKQSTIAGYMGTTTSGTGGAALAAGLNNANAVLKPVADWAYNYVSTGSKANFHNMVVTDIAKFAMPLVLATAPHQANAGFNYLESWPNVRDGAHHWITLRGYNGLPGTAGATISYNDSSAGYGGGTGTYDDTVSVLWQVNDWNQGGHIVW